jgi:predicted nucleic acid-binding protein
VIVVDTSVWIAALGRAAAPETDVLRALLDADEVALPVPVRVELLSGASKRDRPRLRRALSALPLLYPSDGTWSLIDDWVERSGRRGHRFGLGDLLIGALADEVGALVWSLDADFIRMERLKLVRRYEP